jgi:hypothetical protein
VTRFLGRLVRAIRAWPRPGLAFVVLLVAAILGCSDATGPEASGRYPLYSVNGRTLPAPMYQTAQWTREAVGGYVDFNSDSSFRVLFLLHDVELGSETTFEDGVNGFWWQTGRQLQLQFPDGLVLPATIDDDMVTFARVPAGFDYVYRR